jgi:integrase/recombinase XerD
VREPRKIPVVLSKEEVARLLEAAAGPKYKAALSAAYGAGLQVSEVVALKVCDVDSKRMLLKIEQGKGRKDRFAMLSPVLLELLRDWCRIARPTGCLFPGRDRLLPLTTRQFQPRRSCRRPFGRDQEAGDATHAAAQHSHPLAGAEHQRSPDPSRARACQARDHRALRAGVATNTIRAITSPFDRLTPLRANRNEPPA